MAIEDDPPASVDVAYSLVPNAGLDWKILCLLDLVVFLRRCCQMNFLLALAFGPIPRLECYSSSSASLT